MHVINVKFGAQSGLSVDSSYTNDMSHPSLFPQKRGWLKMTSFIKSFCKYRRFMSNVNKRQEFEAYLHQELRNNKESESRLYLLPLPVAVSVPRISPDTKLQSYCFEPRVRLARTLGPGCKVKSRPAERGWDPYWLLLREPERAGND